MMFRFFFLYKDTQQIATKVMTFCKGYALGITRLLMDITSVILKEKFRYIEISARKMLLNAAISGLKVKLFLSKRMGFHYSFENFNDHSPF